MSANWQDIWIPPPKTMLNRSRLSSPNAVEMCQTDVHTKKRCLRKEKHTALFTNSNNPAVATGHVSRFSFPVNVSCFNTNIDCQVNVVVAFDVKCPTSNKDGWYHQRDAQPSARTHVMSQGSDWILIFQPGDTHGDVHPNHTD